ncbi:hypothetical protein JCGZ_16742 [Jatropha curcas]|uniref:Transmembrane protein n=1 Tax=Jatropha curcas TaxID=180498 RepID=A0A067LFZ1_JATCU|nr:hypothetical protein JCGZ_16742 [Jatropha curcas]
MASTMVTRRLSSQHLKSSYSYHISSCFATNNTKFESFAHGPSCIFTQQNPNFHFWRFTSAPPNHIAISESQAPTQPKPTNFNHIFLQSYSSFATKSKNQNFISLTTEKPRLFPSTTFYREKSQISDLKLKEITSTDTLLKNPKPRNFSSSSSDRDRKLSALANECMEETRKMMNLSYELSKEVVPVVIILLGLGCLISYSIKGSPLENYKIVSLIQNVWDLTAYISFWTIGSLVLIMRYRYNFLKCMEEEIKRIKEKGDLDGLKMLTFWLQMDKRTNAQFARALNSRDFVWIGMRCLARIVLLSCVVGAFKYVLS